MASLGRTMQHPIVEWKIGKKRDSDRCVILTYGRLVLRRMFPLFCVSSVEHIVQTTQDWKKLIYCWRSAKYPSAPVILGRSKIVFRLRDAFAATIWGGLWLSVKAKTIILVVWLTVVVGWSMVRLWSPVFLELIVTSCAKKRFARNEHFVVTRLTS